MHIHEITNTSEYNVVQFNATANYSLINEVKLTPL